MTAKMVEHVKTPDLMAPKNVLVQPFILEIIVKRSSIPVLIVRVSTVQLVKLCQAVRSHVSVHPLTLELIANPAFSPAVLIPVRMVAHVKLLELVLLMYAYVQVVILESIVKIIQVSVKIIHVKMAVDVK